MPEPFEPVVEMLWESDAPEVALADRFGFADAESAGQWVVTTVLEVWGISVDSCDRIVLSDHNALAWIRSCSDGYIAKWSVDATRFAQLAALATLTSWLDERGLAVSAPIVALDGNLHVETGGVSIGLQRRVDGKLLDVTNEADVRATGSALAQVHVALADYPFVEGLPQSATEQRQLPIRISAWLDSDRSNRAPGSAVQELRRLASSRSGEHLMGQLVHGDIRSANILMSEGRVAAILDFEEARIDFPVVDLAHAAVLLGTRFRDWGPVSIHVREWFLAGYQSVHPLSEVELQWWDTLVLWFSLMFIPDGEDPTGWRAAALDLISTP